ncbi:Uncharacterised protein [Achromobacter xylosoxidans]|nr:Uncharacterised protein [Achromobacter xylosoxidans]
MLVALNPPACTPVTVRAPAVPAMFTDVPPVAPATVTLPLAASWRTSPVVPLLICVCRLVRLVLVCVIRPPRLVTLPSVVVIRPDRFVMAVVFWLIDVWAVARFVLVTNNCEPLTASVLAAVTSPAARLRILLPDRFTGLSMTIPPCAPRRNDPSPMPRTKTVLPAPPPLAAPWFCKLNAGLSGEVQSSTAAAAPAVLS